ncbi:hypothetical protein E3N88_03081 [Mikania micrantha]|uniref:Uncharacterized protein n=1 Tax=Mikania micrantha TaxID=192012 RepID=A0A5N6Q5K0_9ASTR|nr:hypothetical protein E3N88_03081 [Mikania micrantha]
MSRQLSNSGSRKAIEAAPPRLIRLERRLTMEKKLPTIKEDECTGCDQGSQLQNFHGNCSESIAFAFDFGPTYVDTNLGHDPEFNVIRGKLVKKLAKRSMEMKSSRSEMRNTGRDD